MKCVNLLKSQSTFVYSLLDLLKTDPDTRTDPDTLVLLLWFGIILTPKVALGSELRL